MIQDVEIAMRRSSETLWRDFSGVISLWVSFYLFLQIPGFLFSA